MRACRYCSHQNADHLGYCSQCGRRMAPVTGPVVARSGALAALAALAAPGAGGAGAGPSTPRAGWAPPREPPPRPDGEAPGVERGAADDRRAGASASRLGWFAGSIAYIYVYLREKLDAGERRRRRVEERDGAERLLGGAVKELGQTILAEGIQHPDLTGLLEAIGRAEARREAAASDIVASEKLLAAEEGRLGAH